MNDQHAPLTLSELLEAQAHDAIALIDGDRRISYGELLHTGRCLASGLAAHGIGTGDRVGVLMANVPAWPALLFACARLGAVIVAINTRFGSADVEDILERTACKTLVLGAKTGRTDFAGVLAGVDPVKLSALRTVVVEDAASLPAPSSMHGCQTVAYDSLLQHPAMTIDHAVGDTPCCMFTTSGTTSAPKFVVHKQAALVTHAGAVADAFGYLAPNTVTLQATPFCGIYGFSQAMATLAAGRPIVLLHTFKADAAVKLGAAHGVTQFNGTDDMLRHMLNAGVPDPFPALRFFGCALFGPAAAEIVTQAQARGVHVRGLFGMSETQALLTLQRDDLDLNERMQGGGIGVSAQVEIRVRDPASGCLLAHGESGEVEIRTPGLMLGYFNDPEATSAAITGDGFLRTGDLGYTRPDGGFVFQARMGDVLRLGGYLVSPREIENHLNGHADVASSQVVGVEVQQKLRAVAFVQPAAQAGFTESALLTHCRQALAPFKVPLRIFAIDAFPTTDGPNGRKVQKQQLRELAQRQCSTEKRNDSDARR